jgi:trimethylamine---corrinoid protein Co-methyltransferase
MSLVQGSQASGPRRRGGRKGAAERRTRPLDAVVGPGLLGGAYRPLSDGDMSRVNDAALDVLEKVGMADPPPSCVELFTAAGGWLSDDGRMCIPRALVEDIIAGANRSWVLHGRNGAADVEFGTRKVNIATGGGGILVFDPKTREFRECTLKDLYDGARLIDALDHIHIYHRPFVPRDLPTTRALDVNLAYATLAGTNKPVGMPLVDADNVAEVAALLDHVAGGDGAFAKRPFAFTGNAFVVSPLRLAPETCAIMENAVRAGIPYFQISAPQAGATSPAALAGSLVLVVAEALFGQVYVELLSPGHKTLFGVSPLISDLRTGAMSGGGGEQAVLMAAAGQMGGYYDLPSLVLSGMTDSKMPDVQAGYEKGYSLAAAALAGPSLIFSYAGELASLLAFSFEQAVVDNEVLGNVLRMVRGMEVTEDSLSVDAIAEVCAGPGHFLDHADTVARMKRDYLYPSVGDRDSPSGWIANNRPTALASAENMARDILTDHFPETIDGKTDALIRAKFDIRLEPEDMKPL